jgi:hypothetical protein
LLRPIACAAAVYRHFFRNRYEIAQAEDIRRGDRLEGNY